MDRDRITEDLRLARAGDRGALDRLLEAVQDRVRGIAEGRLGPGLRARIRTSDVLQSTYLDVVKGVATFEGEDESEFVAWVARIMENNIRDKGKFFQARKRRDPAGGPLPIDEAAGAEFDGPTPSVDAVRAEDLVLVSRALEELAEDHRRVIVMRMIEGRSHQEIAEEMNRSESAARMLLSRARAALALKLEGLRRAND